MKRLYAVLLLLWSSWYAAPFAIADDAPLEAATPPAAPAPTRAHEPLPRAIAGVTLGMSRPELDAAVSHLTCHVATGGYQVCNGPEVIGEVRHLEMYLHHDRVISVSYEETAPANAWAALKTLIDRYGRPSLDGKRERDHSGRLHEIYGWKDDLSLYSVRFLWRDTDVARPELVGTVFALWDRKGYRQWEDETHPPPLGGSTQKHDDQI